MVAGYDPIVLLRGAGAGDGAVDIPDGPEGDVLFEVHVNGDFSRVWVLCGGVAFIADGSQVVGEGEAALPLAGGLVAAEGFEDWGGVFVGEGVGGDAWLVGLEF